MTVAGRFARVESLFRAASQLDHAECERFLQEQCAGDDGLLRELRGMLQADRRPPGVLDQPALGCEPTCPTATTPRRTYGTALSAGTSGLTRRVGRRRREQGRAAPTRRAA